MAATSTFALRDGLNHGTIGARVIHARVFEVIIKNCMEMPRWGSPFSIWPEPGRSMAAVVTSHTVRLPIRLTASEG